MSSISQLESKHNENDTKDQDLPLLAQLERRSSNYPAYFQILIAYKRKDSTKHVLRKRHFLLFVGCLAFMLSSQFR